MHIRNGQPFDIYQFQVIGENQYPVGYFFGPAEQAAFNIFEVPTPVPPAVDATHKATLVGFSLDSGVWTPQWSTSAKSAGELASDSLALAAAKVAKNTQINDWREKANFTTFPHGGKRIACDTLSRSDIDAVAGYIGLFGTFAPGFPMAWKAVDNSYLMLADVSAFKAMYAAMVAQGMVNFGLSQDKKTALAAADTLAKVQAIDTSVVD